MDKEPWTHDECSMTIDYVACALRGNCWRPLGEHYVGKTPDKAKKLLADYQRISKIIQKQNPGLEIPIVATRVVKRITFVHTAYEEVTE